MKIWFTSDHHFSHNNILKYCNRPYHNIDEMNRDYVTRWNEVVAPEDFVYYLGDFSLSTWILPIIVPRLNGTKVLYMGNHDRCYPTHSKHRLVEKQYLQAGFKEVRLESLLEVPELLTTLKLSHLPYSPPPPHIKDKLAKYRPHDEGHWLLHGHVHGAFTKIGRQINVGVDVHNGYPISLEKIRELMKGPDIKGEVIQRNDL